MSSRALALPLDLALSSHICLFSLLPGKGLSLDNRDRPRETHSEDPRARLEESYPKCTVCASHCPTPAGRVVIGYSEDRGLFPQQEGMSAQGGNTPDSTIEPPPLDNAGHASHPYPGQFCAGSIACPVQLDKSPHSLHTQTSLTGALCSSWSLHISFSSVLGVTEARGQSSSMGHWCVRQKDSFPSHLSSGTQVHPQPVRGMYQPLSFK